MYRTLHFCWLLDPWKPSREKYLQAWQTAGWDCVLWHGGQLTEPPVEGVRLLEARAAVKGSPIETAYAYEARYQNHAACADLFRYQVLVAHGGAYADIDILPGIAAVPLLFNSTLPRFGGAFMQLRWRPETRFISTPSAQHPLMITLRDSAVLNTQAFIDAGGYERNGVGNTIHRTGPIMAEPHIYAYAKAAGERSYALLLQQATIDSTPENQQEHFTDKFPVIRSIAGLPAETGPYWFSV